MKLPNDWQRHVLMVRLFYWLRLLKVKIKFEEMVLKVLPDPERRVAGKNRLKSFPNLVLANSRAH